MSDRSESGTPKVSAHPYKTVKLVGMVLVPAVVAAFVIAACTGHTDSSASATATTDDRTPASTDATLTEAKKDGATTATESGVTTHRHAKRSKQATAVAHASTDNVYVVQIGAFRVKENAEKLNEKLKSEGYPVVMQPLEHSSNGQLFLVRLNPMKDRSEAENMRQNLKAKADIDSMVLALPKSDRAVSSEGAPPDAAHDATKDAGSTKDVTKEPTQGAKHLDASMGKERSEVH